jgi:PhzF family phenazine biosynthesis protein
LPKALPGTSRCWTGGTVSGIEAVTVVDACTRDGRGGSPTAVMIDGAAMGDDERRAIVRRAGTSHAAFVDTGSADPPAVRFFTTAGELTNCGHGTLAAQAVLLHRSGAADHRGHLRTGERVFATTAVRRAGGIEVWFDQGVIELQDGPGGADVTAALGLAPGDLAGAVRVASPGAPRLLVPVRDHRVLRSMRPDLGRLAAGCRRHGYLGCFAYALAPAGKTAVARMFAPPIGVDEDIVNANSTGCLAAHLLDIGRIGGADNIEVHQGDALGRPSSVLAAATRTTGGIAARIGGLVAIPPAAGPGSAS